MIWGVALLAALYVAWALVHAAAFFDQAFDVDYSTKGEIMNTKELAALIDGIEYGRDYSANMVAWGDVAKSNGLVIVTGESDDLLEFRGAIREEVGAYDGATALVDAEGVLPSWESASKDETAAARYMDRKPNAKEIEAVWCEEGESYPWVLKTDIPHETFSIMEDGIGFCLGIVFSISDLKGGA